MVAPARGRARDDGRRRRRRAAVSSPRPRRLPRRDLAPHGRASARIDARGDPRQDVPRRAGGVPHAPRRRARGVPGGDERLRPGPHRRHGDRERPRPVALPRHACGRARSRAEQPGRRRAARRRPSFGPPSATPRPPCHGSPRAGSTRTGWRSCAPSRRRLSTQRRELPTGSTASSAQTARQSSQRGSRPAGSRTATLPLPRWSTRGSTSRGSHGLLAVAPGEPDSVVGWVASRLTAARIARELEDSTERISQLVQSVRQYSYLDQAQRQEIDVHGGLESTLAILAHKVAERGIEVVREYDRSLPQIEANAPELNQVWTNLIDNALAAANERVTIRTSPLGRLHQRGGRGRRRGRPSGDRRARLRRVLHDEGAG